ncbi:uncharacterized [Tachysurus ichikawai]
MRCETEDGVCSFRIYVLELTSRLDLRRLGSEPSHSSGMSLCATPAASTPPPRARLLLLLLLLLFFLHIIKDSGCFFSSLVTRQFVYTPIRATLVIPSYMTLRTSSVPDQVSTATGFSRLILPRRGKSLQRDAFVRSLGVQLEPRPS